MSTVQVIFAILQAILTCGTIWFIWKAPTWAVETSYKLGNRHEEKERQLDVFRKLMQTRITPNEKDHIGAVNLVCIEFYDSEEILEALEDYVKNLISRLPYEQNSGEDSAHSRNERESFVVLTQKISNHLGYKFEQFDLSSKYFIDRQIN